MIQRIQTLFLLGVAICMGLMLAFPLWEKENNDHSKKISLDVYYLRTFASERTEIVSWKEESAKPVFYIAGIAVLAALLALYSLFRYDNRKLQMRLGAYNALLIMINVALVVYLIYMGEKELGQHEKGEFYIGFYLPLAALIFNSLANRFIRKDEKLVRSVDRIR